VVTGDGIEVRRKITEDCLNPGSQCVDDFDLHDRRREAFESPEQKLKSVILKLGEVVSTYPVAMRLTLTPVQDPIEELPRLTKHIRQQASIGVPAISDAVRTG
jgi:nuclear cap-binding protein subunit 1